MDTSIIAAIIGAIASILAVVVGWWLQHKKGKKAQSTKHNVFKPDTDDINFMQYLLHDAYEQDAPMSTAQLAEHHMKYALLELEVKLIQLEKRGFIQRVNKKSAGMGLWQILPKGVQFMFKNTHQLQDLIEEQRNA